MRILRIAGQASLLLAPVCLLVRKELILDVVLFGPVGGGCRASEVIPSSGFVASVMDAVRHEAAAPPPIAFPWTRALPGMIAAGLALASFFVEITLLVPGTASVHRNLDTSYRVAA